MGLGANRTLWHYELAKVKPNQASIQPKLARWPALSTASAFNRPGKYDINPGNRAYCYTELTVINTSINY